MAKHLKVRFVLARRSPAARKLPVPAKSTMPHERRRVYYSGSVQGVGFSRATCRWLARGFEVAGFVRNLSDGRVELVAEGEAVEIDRFLDAVRDEIGESSETSRFIRNERHQPDPDRLQRACTEPQADADRRT